MYLVSGDCPLHPSSANGAPETEEGNKRQPEKPSKTGLSALRNRNFHLAPLNHTKIRHRFNLKCFCPLPTVHPNRYHVHMSPNRTQDFLKLTLSIVPCYSPGEGGHDQHSLCRQTSRFERSCSSTEETGPVGEPTISIQVENMQKAISLSFGTIHQP